jgi:hypothetical protein
MHAFVANLALGFVLINGAAIRLSAQTYAIPPAAPTVPAAQVTIPSDPADLLRLAARLNGLLVPDAKPWHLKASYDIFNGDGKRAERGIYELLWVNSKKFRRSYVSKSFSQTDYATDRGIFRTGEMEWPSGPERLVEGKLFIRLPSEEMLRANSQHMFEHKVGGGSLRCVTLSLKPPQSLNAGSALPTYCLDLITPALRYESGSGGSYSEITSASTRNQIVSFNNHLFSREVLVTLLDRPYVTIHVDTLEELAQVNDSDFQPPSNAIQPPQMRPRVPQNQMDGMLLKHADLGYAMLASPPPDGRVILEVVVGKDGHVLQVRGLSGSQMLQSAAIEQVRQRVYKPYLVAGEPVEVETEIAMTFGQTKR